MEYWNYLDDEQLAYFSAFGPIGEVYDISKCTPSDIAVFINSKRCTLKSLDWYECIGKYQNGEYSWIVDRAIDIYDLLDDEFKEDYVTIVTRHYEVWVKSGQPDTGFLEGFKKAIKSDKSHTSTNIALPPELDTDRARGYFARAIELGLMAKDYKWVKGLQLLACFAREMSLKLNLGKGKNADGSPRISWKPFEQLFGIETGKLRANYNDIQKTGQQPSESRLIDKVFS